MRAAPPYILIRIDRQLQKDKKERLGAIILAPDHTYMQYNMQCGEIIDIGERAARDFPEAKIGDTAIVHHFVEGEDDNDSKENYLVETDETYNYYVVTPCKIPGKNVDIYGVWDGEKIIPHKDYIFLSPDPKMKVPDTPDEYINSAIQKTEGGIFVFSDWKETYEDITAKMEKIKAQIKEISVNLNLPGVREAVFRMEEELEELSRRANKVTCSPYTVEYASDEVSIWFNRQVSTGDQLFIKNINAQTHVDFMNKKYRIATTNEIHAMKVTV